MRRQEAASTLLFYAIFHIMGLFADLPLPFGDRRASRVKLTGVIVRLT